MRTVRREDIRIYLLKTWDCSHEVGEIVDVWSGYRRIDSNDLLRVDIKLIPLQPTSRLYILVSSPSTDGTWLVPNLVILDSD